MEVGGHRHTPAALPPGKSQYPLYRRLGGPQRRSRQVSKISPPPGFDPRTVQPVASCFTDWAIPVPDFYGYGWLLADQCITWIMLNFNNFVRLRLREGYEVLCIKWSKVLWDFGRLHWTLSVPTWLLAVDIHHARDAAGRRYSVGLEHDTRFITSRCKMLCEPQTQ